MIADDWSEGVTHREYWEQIATYADLAIKAAKNDLAKLSNLISVATALNAKDTGDMRDGYRTTLLNSRGAHWVDPEGRAERELAKKYRDQAEKLESHGYHRLANTLRELAVSYEREAEWLASRDLFDELTRGCLS